MAIYRRKTIPIEAHQWFKNGDHPEDNCETFDTGDGPFQGEGKVVRYYRTPDLDGQTICPQCDIIIHNHGWIDDVINGEDYIVCPGNWILLSSYGSYFTIPHKRFTELYELVEDNELSQT